LNRAVTIGVAGAALAAWLAAAATSGSRDTVRPLVRQSPIVDRRGAALASEIARLHERLKPTATPREPGRNLFSFGSRKARPAALADRGRPAPSEPAIVRQIPPPLRLSGIAEDGMPPDVVRTAILSGFGQLFLVKEGENVTERYRVVRISPEAVELTDVADGSTLRLALK
jgi:hypothetical protein